MSAAPDAKILVASLAFLRRLRPISAWAVAAPVLLAFSAWAWAYSARHQPSFSAHVTVYASAAAEAPVLLETYLTGGFQAEALARRAGLDPRGQFRIEYEGQLYIRESGTYVFEGWCDDAVTMEVAGKPVFEDKPWPGVHRLRSYTALERGLHPIKLTYWQLGGDTRLELSMAGGPERQRVEPLTLLADEEGPVLFRHVDKAISYPLLVATLWSVWVLVGLWLAGLRAAELAAGGTIREVVGWSGLLPLLAAVAASMSVGVELGLWPGRGWGPDELSPKDVLYAMQVRFTDGWFHLYPPTHFYVLALVAAPFPLVGAGNGLLESAEALHRLHLLGRYTSLVMALLVLVSTALLAARLIGRRFAVAAAFCMLGPCFVYYARTTNVDMPYLYWASLATLAFVRCLRAPTYATHVLLGLFTALSVGSKDQAYAIFPGMAAALLLARWRDNAGRSAGKRLAATALDPRTLAGAATFAAAYALVMGLPWNWDGALAHYGLVTGPGSQPFRMFERDAEGVFTLAMTSASLLPSALGPAICCLAIAGVGLAVSSGARRTALSPLALPSVSYIVGFVGVVAYVYDRFLLPLAFPIALLSALSLVKIGDAVRSTGPRLAALAVLAVVGIAPAADLIWRQLHDTRLEAEAWMAARLTSDPLVLGAASPLYLPGLTRFRHAYEFSTQTNSILAWDADVIVINESWLGRPGAGAASDTQGALHGRGYRRQLSLEPADAANSLLDRLAWGAHTEDVFSNLTKIAPPLTIWVRERPAKHESPSAPRSSQP